MNGKLGAASPAAETYTTIYTAPAAKVAAMNLLVTNRGAANATIRVAITTQVTTPNNEDFIEYGAELKGASGAVLERIAVLVGANEKLMVWSSTADVSFRAAGFEGAA